MNMSDTLKPFVMGPQQFAQFMLATDPFGIYAQRRAMAQAMPGERISIWRGHEWWMG